MTEAASSCPASASSSGAPAFSKRLHATAVSVTVNGRGNDTRRGYRRLVLSPHCDRYGPRAASDRELERADVEPMYQAQRCGQVALPLFRQRRISAATLASGRIEQRRAAADAHQRPRPVVDAGPRSFRPVDWSNPARRGQRRPSAQPLPSLSGVRFGHVGSAGSAVGSPGRAVGFAAPRESRPARRTRPMLCSDGAGQSSSSSARASLGTGCQSG